MERNPCLRIGAFGSFVAALVVFLHRLGGDLSGPQSYALAALAAIAGPMVTAVAIRSYVVSPQTAREIAEEAHAAGKAGAPLPNVRV